MELDKSRNCKLVLGLMLLFAAFYWMVHYEPVRQNINQYKNGKYLNTSNWTTLTRSRMLVIYTIIVDYITSSANTIFVGN